MSTTPTPEWKAPVGCRFLYLQCIYNRPLGAGLFVVPDPRYIGGSGPALPAGDPQLGQQPGVEAPGRLPASGWNGGR